MTQSSKQKNGGSTQEGSPLLNPRLGVGLGAAIILVLLSALLLRRDAVPFLIWYLLALLLGLLFLPVTGRLFSHFIDRGWMFSKVLAIAVSGFVLWFLVNIHLLPFTALTSIGVTVVVLGLSVGYWVWQNKKGIAVLPEQGWQLVLLEELLFLAVFLMWTYFAGFRPEAYGTEKFMDYGFMETMMRSTSLPAVDLWYSEGTINYYYGGQYFAVFLTKLSGTQVEVTYNLMRTFVAAFAFVLPFSLAWQMSHDLLSGRTGEGRTRWGSVLAGLTAGAAVSLAGNVHYVVYGCIKPFLQRLLGVEVSSYWFPDATRYIGFHPDVPDKTIHEFPCYSFVLGDLHAHVVNIIFVLLLLGLLYAYMAGKEERRFFPPHILVASWLLGLYQLNNYWDFVIYFVVTGGVVLFTNILRHQGRLRSVLLSTLVHAGQMVVISQVVILPFTLQFETMVSGVRLAQYHSLAHQLLILWGLPVLVCLLLYFVLFLENRKRRTYRGIYGWMEATALPDLFAVITGLCAMGLVLIPELVYVRDIYENGNARANTMFKLTYQAYIMFGITIGYGIWRILLTKGRSILRGLTIAALVLWVWTLGYLGKSVTSWFGQVTNPSLYQGLNALGYLEKEFPADASAIRWLKENVSGVEVVLEANGDSYTGFERVSASTGLPTVLGWYVHEWLWRSDVADLNEKSADIETIYTSEEDGLVRSLLEDYNIAYIFVGAKEQEKYGERLNTEHLKRLGEVAYEAESGTFIVRVKE